MREISPAKNLRPDDFLGLAGPQERNLAAKIRRQKANGQRRQPSTGLIDQSVLLSVSTRQALLDAVAAKVDENLFGRAEMCMQFADLLQRALAYLGFPSRSVLGQAIYFVDRREIFRWEHAWVRVGKEVIDGNVDSLHENPRVPDCVEISPYWGPIAETPRDRRLREEHGCNLPPDDDVSNIWWPELRVWVDKELKTR